MKTSSAKRSLRSSSPSARDGALSAGAEEAPPDETLFLRLAPILAVLALLLAVIVAAVSGCGSDFVYIFSALLAPSVPFMALSAFALPYFLGTARVFRVGALSQAGRGCVTSA